MQYNLHRHLVIHVLQGHFHFMFFLCSVSEGERCLVDIGRIVDHHCLNFLFIITYKI